MDKYEYLKTHFKEIFSTYKIPKFDKSKSLMLSSRSTLTSLGTGLASTTTLSTVIQGTAYVLVNGIPKFKTIPADIYPLIIKYCERAKIEEPTLYTKALVTKSTFSKIRNMKETGYKPNKYTVIHLCIVLQLSAFEMQEMLAILGQPLLNSELIDQVIYYCFENQLYDFRKIDHIYMDNKGNDDKANPLFPVLD